MPNHSTLDGMDPTIASLINSERAKIDVLRERIKVCERRIATLSAMASDDDDLDAALAKRVAPQPSVRSPVLIERGQVAGIDKGAVAAAVDGFPKKALGHTALTLLRFAGTEGKSIDQFLAHAQANNIRRDRQGIRAFLYQYKSNYGLLQSQRDGYFRLSDLGVAYIASLGSTEGATSSAT